MRKQYQLNMNGVNVSIDVIGDGPFTVQDIDQMPGMSFIANKEGMNSISSPLTDLVTIWDRYLAEFITAQLNK